MPHNLEIWLQACTMQRYRSLLVIHGDEGWARSEVHSLLSRTPARRIVWVGDGGTNAQDCRSNINIKQILGQECDVLVYNAWSGFDPDAFGLVSGTVVGGGLILLLTPTLTEWSQYPDPAYLRMLMPPYTVADISGRYLDRLSRLILGDESVGLLTPGEFRPGKSEPVASSSPAYHDSLFRTREQQDVVMEILSILQSRQGHNLIITADRGRGKSAAIGLAIGQTMLESTIQISVTGPRFDAVKTVFRHAAGRIGQPFQSQRELVYNDAGMRFFPPDELLRQEVSNDVLVVDEAASLPLPILQGLVRKFPRIIFASTIQGYEGSGRGFAIRFDSILRHEGVTWKKLSMREPVRWSEGCPVERIIFRALMLDADLVEIEARDQFILSRCPTQELTRDELIKNEKQLRELFGLLVQAHYRTHPADLRTLLDAPQVKLYAKFQGGLPVAVVLTSDEGGYDEIAARDIYLGHRRPRGHLIPQSLAFHAGIPDAARYRYRRIMRIAVHPDLQGNGIGTSMLDHISSAARRDGIDILGCSFGATEALINFWRQNEFEVVRLGLKREQSSGMYSIIMAKPLNNAGHDLVATAGTRLKRFKNDLMTILPTTKLSWFEGVIPTTVTSPNISVMDEMDWQDVTSFAQGLRDFEVNQLAISKWSQLMASDLDYPLLQLLRKKVSLAELISTRMFTGRAEAVETIRKLLRRHLHQ